MSYKFTNKDWFDYISKLSDRKINKSSASGITVWAILTVLVLIVFKIVGIMENIILNRATLLSLINYFSFLMNSIFFIYLVINFIFSSTRKKGGNRLISHTDMKTLNIIIYSLYPILLIAIFSNLFLIFNFKKFYIPKLIYILIITLYILFFIAFIFIKKNIKIESNQGQSIGMEYNNPNIKPQKIISFIYLLPFGFYYIYTFLYIKGKESFIINFNMLYFALYSVGFLLGLIILSINFSNSIASNWLIELERSIILDNLSVEDIKKRFLKGYCGEEVLKWIKQIEKELKSNYKSINEILNDFIIYEKDNLLSYIKDFDELDDRIELIESEFDNLEDYLLKLEEVTPALINNTKLLYELLGNPNLSPEENLYIQNIYNNTKKYIDNYNHLISLIRQKHIQIRNETINLEKDKCLYCSEDCHNETLNLNN